ncbi:hypothetical protein [Kribbella qitaiheensis]|nr:hypothetical protein [Kribbella qitaiheensis]
MAMPSDDGRQRLLWFVTHPGSPAVGQLKFLEVPGGRQGLTTETPRQHT